MAGNAGNGKSAIRLDATDLRGDFRTLTDTVSTRTRNTIATIWPFPRGHLAVHQRHRTHEQLPEAATLERLESRTVLARNKRRVARHASSVILFIKRAFCICVITDQNLSPSKQLFSFRQ